MNATYHIPDVNVPAMQVAIDRANIRAAKLHIQPILVTEIGRDTESYGDPPMIRVWHTIRIQGDMPRLAGWTFAGIIERVMISDNGDSDVSYLLRCVPGQTIPVEYRDRGPICDHCGTRRNRIKTYVLRHDDGRYVTVGSTCIADYLGAAGEDPESIGAWAELLIGLDDLCDDLSDPDFAGARQVYQWELQTVVGTAAAIINRYGWTSRRAAEESGGAKAATATTVRWYLCPGPQMDDEEREQRKTIEASIAACNGEVAAAIAWARNLDDLTNDYLYNLNTVSRMSFLEPKHIGLASSLIPAYRQAEAQRIERERIATVSQHVGVVGTRSEFSVKVERVIDTESQYGCTHITRMTDEAGNVLVWFSSRERLGQGQSYKLMGSIKKHDEYQGVKQTVLTRCKVVS